ncbi:hypothetical protein GALMADRAFT_242266 [Galerina marginata CBS 339.88]|uniref:Uncharacterized protein n=1 Tax=Galerina marginata (strain CBS 339.88) TaxID=685588 RepID=A0A067TA28_GALM3|nr:hypothetical protein GALMADRAFT_242266 [Galerina marginata CBS 339.88]
MPTLLPSTVEQPPRQWHPKITPYRLTFLLTTIALGTTKAIATYHGQSVMSTTMEWISGVIVSLIFYFLDYYDSPENEPNYLTWFFTCDCMDGLWGFLSLLSIPHPRYQTALRKIVTRPYEHHPSVTGYRLLVSMIVTTFGTVKMTCAYLGLDSSTNSVDWTLGVLATSLLYIFGLYERNTVDFAPSFFEENYSRILQYGTISVFYFLLYSLGIALCFIWTAFWSQALSNYIKEPFTLTSTADDGQYAFRPTVIDGVHDFSLKIMASAFFMVYIALGIVGLILMLWAVKRAVLPKGGLVPPFLRSARSAVLSALQKHLGLQRKTIPKSNPFLDKALRYGHLTTRICIRIIGNLLVISTIALSGFALFGFSFRMWYIVDYRKDNVLDSVMKTIIVGLLGGVSFLASALCLQSLFR